MYIYVDILAYVLYLSTLRHRGRAFFKWPDLGINYKYLSQNRIYYIGHD